MIIRIDADLALPVYEQIREQVVRMTVAGTLEEGSRLPTIRQLAKDLHLAKGTVAKAYALLEAASVVESRGHKGTFVLPLGRQTHVDDGALGRAAEAFATTSRQLGASLDDSISELRDRWIE